MTLAQAQQTVRQLGQYQLLAKIGEGGISTVHVAKIEGPAGFTKLAVVKQLRPELMGSRDARALFLNEMRLAARLAHPNVVHAYDANEDRGQLFLAMEYLDGQPWSRVRRALVQRGELSRELHLKVLAEVLAGLHYAHELRDYDGSPLHAVHCDVSPENVFVTHEGLVKVVDFGVARAVLPGAATPALVGGKLSYIAPEQLRGEAIDRRADIFAVGVMLWEALARQRFAPAKGPDTRRRRERGLEPRVAAVAPATPAPLREICDRALALDPKARFATAAEFRDALLHVLGEDMQDSDRHRLGALIRHAFRDDRARVHGILEHALKSSQAPRSHERWTAPAPAPASLAAAPPPTARTLPITRLAQPAVLLLGAGVGVLSFLVTLALSRPQPDIAPASLPATHTHPRPTAPVTTATQPATSTIQLSIAASPASAVLYLDGVPLAENPYTARLLRDHRVHSLYAATDDLTSRPRLIAFDRDRAVSFDLEQPVVPVDPLVPVVPKPAATAPHTPTPKRPAGSGPTGNNAESSRGLNDLYDRPLRRQSHVRPIDEQNPYP
ncbi:MAG: serine/threonine-protein kinase [Polyangiales bacterium]